MTTTTIGFIGGGNMASSLIGGLITQGQVQAKHIFLFEPNADKAQALAKQHHLNLAATNDELVNQADIVVIAVKPQVLQSVLEPVAASFRQKQPLIVSVVAGIRAESIEGWLGGAFSVVRVMPNTPALIGKGASGLYGNDRVTNKQRELTETLLSAVGCSAWVNSESDIDSVTALSGSGPAYFMLFLQALIEAGESAGLTPEAAKTLAVQTALGAAELVASSEQPLQTLIDNVTSPNGTTERALHSFANDDLKGTVAKAFAAAKQRSAELAEELG